MENGLPGPDIQQKSPIQGVAHLRDLGSCVLNNILTEITVPSAYDDGRQDRSPTKVH